MMTTQGVDRSRWNFIPLRYPATWSIELQAGWSWPFDNQVGGGQPAGNIGPARARTRISRVSPLLSEVTEFYEQRDIAISRDGSILHDGTRAYVIGNKWRSVFKVVDIDYFHSQTRANGVPIFQTADDAEIDYTSMEAISLNGYCAKAMIKLQRMWRKFRAQRFHRWMIATAIMLAQKALANLPDPWPACGKRRSWQQRQQMANKADPSPAYKKRRWR